LLPHIGAYCVDSYQQLGPQFRELLNQCGLAITMIVISSVSI
jgi:hypothetical protein